MRVRSLGKREVSFGADIRQWVISLLSDGPRVPEECQLDLEGIINLRKGGGSVSRTGVSCTVCSGEPGWRGPGVE